MCGIFGSVSPPIGTQRHKKWIDQSLNLLKERGPDSQGHLVFKNVTMGATRLRVHDTREIADQPMTSSCGLFSIIFNGAIYNYRDLRKDLSVNGVHFDTESDTEVLLKSFIAWGVSCFAKLRGMFSFALLDKANCKLYICRDQLGIKPLYYSLSKKHIVFSSLIKPILAFSSGRPSVEKTKIPEQFAFQSLAPPSTMFSGVSALRPGYYITVDFLNGFSAKQFCYWKIDDSLISPPSCDGVEELLTKNIYHCWDNDRASAIQLSGGVDSSVLVALTSVNDIAPEICTHSVVFDSTKDSKFFWNSEEVYARFVGEKFGCKQNFSIFSDDQINKALLPAIYQYEQPLYSANSVLYFLHSMVMSQSSTVIIYGEGADDIFLGYFDGEEIDNNLTSMAPQYIKDDVLCKLFGSDGQIMAKQSRNEVIESDRLKHFSPRQKASALTIETVLYGLLARQDRMLMSHSIEGRPPFCSVDLVNLRFSMADAEIHSAGVGKQNIRKIAEKYFSEKFIYRKKQWLAGPTGYWCQSNSIWKPFIEAIDLEMLSNYMNVDYLRSLIMNLRAGDRWTGPDLAVVFASLNFSLWHRMFIEKSLD